MIARRNRNCRPSMSRVSGPVNRADPVSTWTPLACIASAESSGAIAAIAPLTWAMTAAKSTTGGAAVTPTGGDPELGGPAGGGDLMRGRDQSLARHAPCPQAIATQARRVPPARPWLRARPLSGTPRSRRSPRRSPPGPTAYRFGSLLPPISLLCAHGPSPGLCLANPVRTAEASIPTEIRDDPALSLPTAGMRCLPCRRRRERAAGRAVGRRFGHAVVTRGWLTRSPRRRHRRVRTGSCRSWNRLGSSRRRRLSRPP